MDKIKSYQKIWNAEGTLYSINDLKLPFAFTYLQIGWFVSSLLIVIILGDIPPFSLVDNWLLKYIGFPAAVTILMSKFEFDSKKPWEFLYSYFCYLISPKKNYGGKPLKSIVKYRVNEEITIVRSDYI